MPKQTTKLETRLAEPDRIRFEELVRVKGCTRTELAREAILYYLEHHKDQEDAERFAERDKLIVDALKSMEVRFAGLMVRLGVDMETLHALMWTRTDKNTREKLWEACRVVGQQRFKRALAGVDRDFKAHLARQGDKL